MIERQTSAELVNDVINHPSVHPWISGPIEGRIDLTKVIEDGSYIALMGEHGGFLFWQVRPGIFDAHSAVLPEGRGRWAIRAARESLEVMFTKYDAQEIMMAAPKGNLAVLALIRALKAKHRGTIEDGWWLEGQAVSSEIYSLTKTDWEQCQLSHH